MANAGGIPSVNKMRRQTSQIVRNELNDMSIGKKFISLTGITLSRVSFGTLVVIGAF